MTKALFIDMDNTLIETTALYDAGAEELARLINRFTEAPLDDVRACINARQEEAHKTLGYSAAMLPQAYENTLRHYLPDASHDHVLEARQAAWDVLTANAEIKQGVAQDLQRLASHYRLYLVTVGDPAVQSRRVDYLPFKPLFKDIFIVSEKTETTYASILKKLKLKPAETVMIGDSLVCDIVPTVAVGMRAIYIPASGWQAGEKNASLPSNGVHVCVTFNQAAAVLVNAKKDMRARTRPAAGRA